MANGGRKALGGFLPGGEVLGTGARLPLGRRWRCMVLKVRMSRRRVFLLPSPHDSLRHHASLFQRRVDVFPQPLSTPRRGEIRTARRNHVQGIPTLKSLPLTMLAEPLLAVRLLIAAALVASVAAGCQETCNAAYSNCLMVRVGGSLTDDNTL
ncbi:hypothetical protein BC567DRAFT_222508 [Phyllosticta citribraziliensis]